MNINLRQQTEHCTNNSKKFGIQWFRNSRVNVPSGHRTNDERETLRVRGDTFAPNQPISHFACSGLFYLALHTIFTYGQIYTELYPPIPSVTNRNSPISVFSYIFIHFINLHEFYVIALVFFFSNQIYGIKFVIYATSIVP